MEKIKNVLVCDGVKAELFSSEEGYTLVYKLNGQTKEFKSSNMKDVDIVINTLKKMKPRNRVTAESVTTKTDNIILTSEFGEGRLDKVKDNFGDLLNMFSIQQRTNELIKLFPEVDNYELKKIAETVIKEGIVDYKEFASRKLMIDAENKVLNEAKKKRPNKNDFINKGLNSSFTPDKIDVGSDSDFKLAGLIGAPEEESKSLEDDMPILLEATTDNPDYENLCDILEQETDNIVVVAYQEEEMMDIAVIVANDGEEIKLIKATITKNKMESYDVVFRIKYSEAIENPDDEDSIYAQEDRIIVSADCYIDALLNEKSALINELHDEDFVKTKPDGQIVINAPKMGDDILSLGQSKLAEIFQKITDVIEDPKDTMNKDDIFEGKAFLSECEYKIGSDTFFTVNLNNEVPLYITKDKNLVKAAYKELLNVFNS